jgi:plastocyanin
MELWWWGVVWLSIFLIGVTKSGFGSGFGLMVVPLIAIALGHIPSRGSEAALGLLLPLMLAGDVIAVWQYRELFSLNIVKKLLPGTAVGVTVSDFLFTPRDTAVQVGGTVTWTWSAGATQHNVTYTNGPAQLPDSSGTRTAPASFSTTFTTPGRYSYHCTVHAGMDGTVTVVN